MTVFFTEYSAIKPLAFLSSRLLSIRSDTFHWIDLFVTTIANEHLLIHNKFKFEKQLRIDFFPSPMGAPSASAAVLSII